MYVRVCVCVFSLGAFFHSLCPAKPQMSQYMCTYIFTLPNIYIYIHMYFCTCVFIYQTYAFAHTCIFFTYLYVYI